MPDYAAIYRQEAGQYEALVSREDYQHNILRALEQIVPLQGKQIVDLGAGTGRLTCLLAPRTASIWAFDVSLPMLQMAAGKLRASGLHNWLVAVGDHRRIPLASQAADVVVSGWSICYLVVWNEATWQAELARGLEEMRRIVRPGGTLVILETLGTGAETPQPPENLVAYYVFLEKQGFRHTWMRTDYQFTSRAEADTLVRFFFGEEMLAKIVERADGVFLPECTGVWTLKTA